MANLMRTEWNRRAQSDAFYYVAFARPQSTEEEFDATAAETLPAIVSELGRLPLPECRPLRALEIGCGPGRLMLPLSQTFGEIHGVDISDEMIAIARRRLAHVPHAHLHVNEGADLPAFEEGYFDAVYSYAVFQHIPEKAVVLGYLKEALRVLRPGGVARVQLRGTPPLASEMASESVTWTGCYFTVSEVVSFCRESGALLLAVSGEDTQYLWVTLGKPEGLPEPGASPVLVGVTSAVTFEKTVPNHGSGAALSLWLAGLPMGADLSSLEVCFDGAPSMGCWLSPRREGGGLQLNALLPRWVTPGIRLVTLRFQGRSVAGEHSIQVVDTPYCPRIVSVRDGVDLTSGQIRSNSMKILLEDVADPGGVEFHSGKVVLPLAARVLVSGVEDRWEYEVQVPLAVLDGDHVLTVKLAGGASVAGRFAVERDGGWASARAAL